MILEQMKQMEEISDYQVGGYSDLDVQYAKKQKNTV